MYFLTVAFRNVLQNKNVLFENDNISYLLYPGWQHIYWSTERGNNCQSTT